MAKSKPPGWKPRNHWTTLKPKKSPKFVPVKIPDVKRSRMRLVAIDKPFMLRGGGFVGDVETYKINLIVDNKNIGSFFYALKKGSIRGLIHLEGQYKISPKMHKRFLKLALTEARQKHKDILGENPIVDHACVATSKEAQQLRRWGVITGETTVNEAIRILGSPHFKKDLKKNYAIRDKGQFERNLALIWKQATAKYRDGRIRPSRRLNEMPLSQVPRKMIIAELTKYFQKYPFVELFAERSFGAYGLGADNLGLARIENIHRLPSGIFNLHIHVIPGGPAKKGQNGIIFTDLRGNKKRLKFSIERVSVGIMHYYNLKKDLQALKLNI